MKGVVADTVATTGGLVGMNYGYEDIPEEWGKECMRKV